VTTETYRTTDNTKWGVGKGSNLTAAEADNNFWADRVRIAALETAVLSIHAGIDHFTVSGSSFNVVLTDSTVLGPYTLPTVQFRYRGAWAPSTVYSVYDTFTVNGGLYEVIFAHTSASSFSAGANDGAGHDYYALWLATPGNSLPTGGAVGQVVQKSTTSDFAVTWGYKLPTGGSQYQVLMKASSTNQDAAWSTLDGARVAFHGSTSSTLTASNVTDAIEEVEANLQALSTTVGGGTSLEHLSNVHAATGDPQFGAMLFYGSGALWHMTQAPTDGQVMKWNSGANAWEPALTVDTIQFVIDGGGSVITTGMKGYVEVPWNYTITEVTLLGDNTGSIVVNVYKCSYGQFDGGATHPVAGDKITSSAPPTISSATKSQDSTLSGWTKTGLGGSILAFNVDSVTTLQRVTISLKVLR
jgi:hypothetical protein